MISLQELLNTGWKPRSKEEAEQMLDAYFKRFPAVKQWNQHITKQMNTTIQEQDINKGMQQRTINSAAPKPIRSMYISVEEYSRVVDGLGTQLQLQSRMTDHLSDQLILSREQINNQSEYIQQLKKDRLEYEASWQRTYSILIEQNKTLEHKLASKHKRSSSKK